MDHIVNNYKYHDTIYEIQNLNKKCMFTWSLFNNSSSNGRLILFFECSSHATMLSSYC